MMIVWLCGVARETAGVSSNNKDVFKWIFLCLVILNPSMLWNETYGTVRAPQNLPLCGALAVDSPERAVAFADLPPPGRSVAEIWRAPTFAEECSDCIWTFRQMQCSVRKMTPVYSPVHQG